jgi:CRISPR-associated endonuclease/helicase Cas3
MAAVTLLAKSRKEGQPEKTLAEHSREVMDAFEALFGQADQPTRLGLQWLRFFRLGAGDFQVFHVNGVAACGLHDIGKANDGFQRAVRGERDAQVMRHEHLSALILFLPQFRDWLASHPLLDAEVVISAVAGHHLKASPRNEKYPAFGEKMGDVSDWLKVENDADDFKLVLAQVAARLGMCECNKEVSTLWCYRPGSGQNVHELSEALIIRFNRKRSALKESTERHALLLAVKAAVIAADAAGSGLVREGHGISPWIADAFDEGKLLDGARIGTDVIVPRIAEIERKSKKAFVWNDFQDGAACLPDRALLLAACGSGKTLAAWRWIQACLEQRTRQRVIFLYPTRATATEGFRDYVSHAPETDAALVHGTSVYELQDMFTNPADTRTLRSYETEDRLYALAYWQRRIFSATVDQFLGFMQQIYRSVCLLPVLADSVVVFDEIHSFDKALFSTLKKFLERFDVPVLCMTASLPKRRRDDLVKLGFKVFPDAADQFADLERLAGLPRYRVETLDSQQAALQKAKDAMSENKRCLWVVNTVDRCQQLARELSALCYHSRFTLDDRTERHREVVSAFQPGNPSVIAVTTQVCEMSLDLDAEVLISEVAPITAMIQRMGRCNRHAQDSTSPVGRVYFYAPEKPEPYNAEDLRGTPDFVAMVQESTISQTRLEELLEQFGPDAPEPDRIAAFIDDGFWSRGGREDLRDGLDFSVPAILDAHIERYLQAIKHKKPTDGFVVPVPRKLAQNDPRLGWMKTAPASHYDPRYGFFKEPLVGRINKENNA